MTHGRIYAYQQGCRCDLCRMANRDQTRRHRERHKNDAVDPMLEVMARVEQAYAETEPEFFVRKNR